MKLENYGKFIDEVWSVLRNYHLNTILRYHNATHVIQTLHTYSEHFLDSEDSLEEMMALAFHDIVYIPGSSPGVNEGMSADMFMEFMGSQKFVKDWFSEIDVNKVRFFILATEIRYHMEPNETLGNMIRSLYVQHFSAEPNFLSSAIEPGTYTLEKAIEAVKRILDCDLSSMDLPYPIFKRNQFEIKAEANLEVGNRLVEYKLEEMFPSVKFLNMLNSREGGVYRTEKVRSKSGKSTAENIRRFTVEITGKEE